MALTDILPSSAASGLNAAASSNFNPVNAAANGRAFADTLANNWLVKPATAEGIAGFVFDYDGETQISVENDITDHYTEKNRFFQDHSAIKPMEITMKGFVGEIVQKAPQGILGALDILQSKLTTLPALLGKYTPGEVKRIQALVTKATGAVNQLDSVIGRAQNLVSLIAGGSPAPTKMEQAFAKLMALRDTSQVFSLVSPWGLLAKQNDIIPRKAVPRSFIIRRIMFMSDEHTKSWMDISVTMKEVRFAEVIGSAQNAKTSFENNQGRAVYQRQLPINKGKTTGLDVDFTMLSSSSVFKAA